MYNEHLSSGFTLQQQAYIVYFQHNDRLLAGQKIYPCLGSHKYSWASNISKTHYAHIMLFKTIYN